MIVGLGTASANAASGGSIDRQFSDAVARVLASVHNDYLDNLSAADKRAFVSCAQSVMDAAPAARKQYVLAAPNIGEMRQRFDEVALDNHAQLKQTITRQCAK